MAQSKVTKKPGRHNRNPRSEREQNASLLQHQEYPLVVPRNIDDKERAATPVPALLTGPHTDVPSQAQHKPTPLAVIPQPLQATAAHAPNRKLTTVMGALLVSVCLIAAAIFSFGISKTNRGEMHMAQADSGTLPITAAAESGKGGHAATSAPPTDKRVAATRAKRADAKPVVTASKAGSPTPRADKKVAQERTKPGSKPDLQRVADNAKKKPAPIVAKAPKKASEDKPVPLLAQNTTTQAGKSTGTQDSYAQCQDLGNFFRREQCKWQTCSGKWGQDGCPSYASYNREFQ